MDNTIEAKYYDGLSSVSRQITVIFHNTMSELHLQTGEGISFIWKLEDLQFEQYDSLLEIRNKNFPSAILKIDDKDFSKKFYATMKQNKYIDIHTRLLKLGLSKIVGIAIGLLGLIVLAYFYVLPVIAEKSAVLIPESFDNELGAIFMNSFLNENTIDTPKTKYLEQFAAELNLKNKKPLQFTVIQSEEVNAFALPNGQIVVFSGILKDMENPAALAALLGHEAAHINHRHSIKILCKNLAGYMLVSLLFSDVNGIMAVLAENAQQLHSLSYSRNFEREADKEGLKILMDNKINPNGMIDLFEQLEKESEIAIPKIISSHPLTKERKEYIQKIIAETDYKVKPNNRLNSIFKNIKN